MNLSHPQELSSYRSKFNAIAQKIQDAITKEIEVLSCKTREKAAIKMYSGGVTGQIAAIHLRNQIESLNKSIILLEHHKKELITLLNRDETKTMNEWIHQTQALQKTISLWIFPVGVHPKVWGQ